MIKDNQKSLNHVQVLLDAVVTAVAYILAWFIIVSGKVVPLRGATLEPGPYFLALIFIVPVYLILNGCFHLYVPKRIQGRRVEFANICKANVIGLMLFYADPFRRTKLYCSSGVFLNQNAPGVFLL